MPTPVHDPVHRASYAFEPDGENLFVDAWLEPGGGLPAHLHPAQEERWSVVAGRARIRVGSEKRVVRPEDGEVVVLPGTTHAIESLGEEAHLRCHVIPALDLEDFLTNSAAAAREGLFMRGGIPRNLRGARWAAGFLKRHRETVVMTFPPRFVQSAMIALLGRSADRAGSISPSSSRSTQS
jgi:mannose-6-phosphate isomerase-like protein (cupin superfamily)